METMTAAEVADVFRVDPRTIRAWARAGRLKPVNPEGTRKLRFSKAEIESMTRSPRDAA